MIFCPIMEFSTITEKLIKSDLPLSIIISLHLTKCCWIKCPDAQGHYKSMNYTIISS